MRGYFSSIFFFALFLVIGMFILIFLSGYGGKFMAKLIWQYDKMQKEKVIPIFRLSDVSYEDYGGGTTYIKFNLINLGDSIKIKNWILEFYTTDGSLICRSLIDPLGAGSATLSALDTIQVVNRNVTLNYGDSIAPGDIVYIEARLSGICSNETTKYAYQGETIIFKLVIPPSGQSVVLHCNVDPYSGLAKCTE